MVKFSFEAESPLEFYRVISAIASVGPFAEKGKDVWVGRLGPSAPVEESDEATGAEEPDVGQATTPIPPAQVKKPRGRPKKDAAAQPSVAERAPSFFEVAAAAQPQAQSQPAAEPSKVVATPEMASQAMHRLFAEVSAQLVTTIAIEILGPNPGLSAKSIEASGKAQQLYDRAIEELKKHGKPV